MFKVGVKKLDKAHTGSSFNIFERIEDWVRSQ